MAIIRNMAQLTYNGTTTVNSNTVKTEIEETEGIEIVKVALMPDYVVNEPLGIMLSVNNKGENVLKDVKVREYLGTMHIRAFNYVENSIVATNDQETVEPTVEKSKESLVISNLGDLKVGGTINIGFSVVPTVMRAEGITNLVGVSATSIFEETVFDTDNITITPREVSNVTLLKSAHSSVKAGGSLPYTLIIENRGTSTAENVTFTDKMPLGYYLDGIEVTVNGKDTITYNSSEWKIDGRTVTFPVNVDESKKINIPAGSFATAIIIGRAPSGKGTNE